MPPPPAGQQPPPYSPQPPPRPSRLYRSRTDRILGGVAAGVAVELNLDPSLVRVGWVLLAIFTGGLFALVYLVMWLVVPEAPWEGPGPTTVSPPGPGAVPGWQPPPPSGAPPGQAGQATPGPAAPIAAGFVAGSTPQANGAPSAEPPGEAPQTASSIGPAPAGQEWESWEGAGASAPPTATSGAPGMSTASIVIGLILIVIGGVFLLEQLVPQFDVGDFWPLIPIVIGGALLYTALRPRPGA